MSLTAPHASTRRTGSGSSFETRMLAMADRLFNDFDHVPVMVVIRAIGAARSELREADAVAVPEHVERLARERLQRWDPAAA